MIGYAGCGKLMAFEIRTLDGSRSIVGRLTTGGSGALSGTTTVEGVLGHPVQLPESAVATGGGSTFRSPRRKLPVTGGIDGPFVTISSGTFVGSVGGAMA